MHINMIGRQSNLSTQQSGFTLIELAIVLFIVSMLMVFLIPTSTALLNNQKRELTRQKLKAIETALANFVAVNKRLPCPADGYGLTGTELRNPLPNPPPNYTVDCAAVVGTPANNNQQTGVVPWTTLGLTRADTLDAWDRQFTYRAAFGLTKDNALEMGSCDPAGTGATNPDVNVAALQATPLVSTAINLSVCDSALACTGTGIACSNPQKFLINRGFRVLDDNNGIIMNPLYFTGAAYVVISHGENGVGAISNAQILISSPAMGVDGPLEALNHNNGNAVSSVSTTISPQFRDAPFSATDAAYFDDYLVRPTVFSLIQRAQVGPRSH